MVAPSNFSHLISLSLLNIPVPMIYISEWVRDFYSKAEPMSRKTEPMRGYSDPCKAGSRKTAELKHLSLYIFVCRLS